MEIQHIAHQHSLILNENYIAREGDVCRGCKEEIVSCKSFVYSCSLRSSITGSFSTDKRCVKFLLHKNCAELPSTIQNPTNPKQFLNLSYGNYGPAVKFFDFQGYGGYYCDSCRMPVEYRLKELFYCSKELNSYVCVRCAMLHVESLEVPTFHHPAHTKHPLALINHPSSFKCVACNVDDNSKELSYRCTKCQFWVHKTCADAPTSFKFHCHDKHPLILTFDLPQRYLKFSQHCRLCRKLLSGLRWLYYCPKCRFFAHFHCARLSQTSLRSSADEIYDSSLVQVPPADESMVNVLFEQLFEAMSTLNQNDDSNTTCSNTSSTSHWAHPKHPLQLITINDLNDDDEMLLQCDGCAKPIRTNGDDQFYSCVPCKFSMHRVCAEFPREIKHHLWRDTQTLSAGKTSEPYYTFICDGCSSSCSGIFFRMGYHMFHIGCVVLPKIIKHEAHHHQLKQVHVSLSVRPRCNGCNHYTHAAWRYGCEQCDDFYVCFRCIMKPRIVKH